MNMLHIHIKRSLWLSIGVTLLFNSFLFAFLLLKPGSSGFVILLDNCAQATGPFLILSLFLFSVFHARKFSIAQKAVSPAQKARRKVYVFLGIGLFCFSLGSFLWAYYIQILHLPPTPSWADVVLLSAYPFLALGILMLPMRSLTASHRIRIFLDSLIVMAAVLTFSWYFILGPIIQAGSATPIGMLITSAYPLSDLLLIFCLVIATFPAHATDRESLVNAADHAMYAAKKLGRNQVRSISDPVIQTLEAMLGKAGLREETSLAGVVEALTALLEARDGYRGQHIQRVGKLTLQLALKLGLDASEAHMIELAGRLHDVGKIGIPDAVLHKPSRLTEDEWEIMRKHPILGAEVVSRIPALRALAVVIRAHHERWDGTGYPDKLVGEAIPLGARIVAVVDAYAAMTTDRPYQKQGVSRGQWRNFTGALAHNLTDRS